MCKGNRVYKTQWDMWFEGALMVLAAVAFAVVLALPWLQMGTAGYTQEEQQLWQAYQNGELIRLHVLADSDEPEAQRVKLKVRDAILQAFGEAFSDVKDSEQAYAALESRVQDMQNVALRSARNEGFMGSVTAEVGVLSLPAKQYGHITLPKGDYRALRVTLGSGRGQNWWCVLFPQLCLAIADDGTAKADVVWDSKQIFQNWMLFSP